MQCVLIRLTSTSTSFNVSYRLMVCWHKLDRPVRHAGIFRSFRECIYETLSVLLNSTVWSVVVSLGCIEGKG